MDVWVVELGPAGGGSLAGLDSWERARADGYHSPAERARFIGAHRACRQIIGAVLARAPGDVVFSRAASGKPAIAGASLQFSLSRSAGLAVVAITAQPVGIDIERIRPGVWTPSFAAAQFGAAAAGATDEQLFELWTRREAWAKLTGAGVVGESFAGDRQPAHLLSVPLPAGYAGTTAVVDPVSRLVTHNWRV